MDNYVFSRKDVDNFIKGLSIPFGIEKKCIAFFGTCVSVLNLDNVSLSQKIEQYHLLWKNTIIDMYDTELPYSDIKPIVNINIELTPFSIITAELSMIDYIEAMAMTESDKSYCLNSINNINEIESSSWNDERKINFMMTIFLMPPLSLLGNFYRQAYEYHCQKSYDILRIVQNMPVNNLPYKTNLGLKLATNFVDQKTYEKYGGMIGIINNPKFHNLKNRLLKIKDECAESAILPYTRRCPHCGKEHSITVNQNDIFWARLKMLHSDVEKELGLLLLDEYREMFKEKFETVIQKRYNILNNVENPKCYILVEGDTEELAIPYMAIKYGKPLSSNSIKVWNSKTKQKVLMDFEKIMKNSPDIKMCVLLDGDAKKEIDHIQRMTKEKLDRYAIYHITGNGTFEDIIDIDISIMALNKIYGDNKFSKSDFEANKNFLNQVEKKLHSDCTLGKFDKIEFIKVVLQLMDKEHIPEIIKKVIDTSYSLVKQA